MDNDGIEVEHIFCGGVYAKKLTFKRGIRCDQHAHSFDHLSVVAAGFFRVTVGDDVRDYGPGDTVQIEALSVHSVHALTPGVWLCIHRTDCTDPATVDTTLIQPSTP